jgi:hypothetical protein
MYNSGNSSKNVRGSNIIDGTVETVDIADDAVTVDKLANAINTDIATGVSGSTTAGDALPKAGGAMTGAITTNSTFDGRDVATDGAALDVLDLAINSSANATAITIDASENVGIGTTSPDGRLHVQTATAGTVTASPQADDLVVENSVEGGITIITPDAYSARIRFTSPSTNTDVGGADIFYRQNINKMSIGTTVAGGVLGFKTDNSDEALLITADGRGLSQFTAKAWVNFNGTGTVAIRDSHNVSSITDNGTGDYTTNFTNAMANTNYSVSLSATVRNNAASILQTGIRSTTAGWTTGAGAMLTTSVRTLNRSSSGSDIDTDVQTVVVFGD